MHLKQMLGLSTSMANNYQRNKMVCFWSSAGRCKSIFAVDKRMCEAN